MTFEVVDIGRGDVLGVFDSMDAAQDEVREMCEDNAELGEDIAIVSFDEEGHRVGDPLPAEQFLHVPAQSA